MYNIVLKLDTIKLSDKTFSEIEGKTRLVGSELPCVLPLAVQLDMGQLGHLSGTHGQLEAHNILVTFPFLDLTFRDFKLGFGTGACKKC